ncbi:CoA transferase [Mycobacterium innocens]|uniref:CoA transferase n=1 Tax=Mycobacterium innocens TaxID=2341083 RepID=UPI002449BB32|nr:MULTISPECIES: CoA transferase [Mycobacterium]
MGSGSPDRPRPPILADWGADVIKIEPPTGDPGRMFGRMLGWPSCSPRRAAPRRASAAAWVITRRA